MQMQISSSSENSAKNSGQLIRLKLEDIKPGRYQPRKKIADSHVNELADSMGDVGLNEPIVVTASPSDAGRFELVSGEYRWRAAAKLGWATIEVYLTSETDRVVAIAAITANGGLPLDPIEEAEAFARLHDEFQMTHAQIAKSCGKGGNRAYVSKAIRMLKLPTIIRDWIAEKKLFPTHAQIFLEFGHLDIIEIARRCVEFDWSTQKLKEELAVRAGTADTGRRDSKTVDWMELEDEMSKKIGLPIEIKSKGKLKKESYDVKLQCKSKAQLQALLHFLKDYRGTGETDVDSQDIAAA